MADREARYIYVNAGKNSNKGWVARQEGCVVTSYWGRIRSTTSFEDGELSGVQRKEWSFSADYAAEKHFNKKCREKERKGYKAVEVENVRQNGSNGVSSDMSKIATEQIDFGCQVTQKLVQRLSKENVHNILSNTALSYSKTSGLFKTPMGVVTKRTVDEARNLLSEIAVKIQQGNTVETQTVEDYLHLIPQDTGRQFDPRWWFRKQDDVIKQNNILDSLQGSLDTIATQPVVTEDDKPVPKVFDCRLHLVEDPVVIARIKNTFNSTRQGVHVSRNLNVKRVFEIEVADMKRNFDVVKDKINNVKELWHGTKVSNILSIFSKGLIVPPANAHHCTGRMYGAGVYASDQSTKALNYSYGYWDGVRSQNCFMFLVDMAMGKEYVPQSTGWGQTFPKPGFDSTFAKARVSGVLNNEMIVYKINQVNLKYLIEFE